MIANKWYCIAQTSTFDTRCSINVAFDGHDIQFSASVKYGASSINITRCIIPDGISFSIRLRESGSQWFVDITSNTKITPVVTVADSEYWSSVNKPAAEGNIILLLTDITSKYNTSSFGGDSLFELVNVGTSDVPRYAVVPKVFQGQNPGVISRTFMTFGGLGADSNGEDDPSGASYLRNLLDVRLSELLEDSDVLTYDKNQGLWVNKKGGFNEEKLEEYLEKYKYITEDDIKGLLVLLQWFEFDDANHAVRVKSDFNFVVPNALSFGGLGSYSGGGEGGVSYLKNLLDVQLGTLLEDGEVLVYDRHLDRWVNKSIETGLDVNELQKYLTDNQYITLPSIKGLQDQVALNKSDIALLLSWFEYDEENHAVRVKSDFNFIVPKALSFGGAGVDNGAEITGVSYLKDLLDVQLGNVLGDGEVLVYDRHTGHWVNKVIETGLDVDSLQKYLTDNKYITSAAVDGLQGQINNNATNIALLLSWLEYDEVNKALRVKNGYNFIVDGALSFGGLGEDDNPTPGGLTHVTIQLGNNPNDSYVSENGKVILPAYPVIPTLLSAFENDKGYLVVSDLDGYAKLTDIPSVEGFALAEDLNALSKQIEGYDNKFADIGESILDIEEDISKLAPLADLEKLEEAVNPLFGYFDATGSANNALKLGGQLPSYYATKSALDTTNGNVVSLTQRMGTAESGISTNKTNIATLTTGLSNLTSRVSTAEGTIKSHTDSIALNANNIASNAKSITTNATAITAVSNRVKKFEDVIDIDKNGDVYIKGTRNFYTEGGTIGMAGLGSGGSGGGGGTAGLGSVTVRVNGQDYITDASGIVTIPDYLTLSGGTISGSAVPLNIQGTNAHSAILFNDNTSTSKGQVGWTSGNGTWLYNYASSSYIAIGNDGIPRFNAALLLHSGNYTDYALSKNGGTIESTSYYPLILDTTQTINNGIIYTSNKVNKAQIGWNADVGTFLLNYSSSCYLGVNDNGTPYYMSSSDWVFHTLYHTGNFNPANYLPLSGGTISNAEIYKLTLNTTEADNYNLVGFAKDGTVLGYIGTIGNSFRIKFSGYEGYFNDNTLLHTGNYADTTDKRYLQLSGGTLTSLYAVVLRLDTTHDIQNAFVLRHKGVDKTQLGYVVGAGSYMYDYSTGIHLGIDTNGAAYCGTSTDVSSNNHHLLIHSGNIGSQSVNYANSAGSADVIDYTYSNQSIDFANNESKIRLISGTSSNALENGFPVRYVSGISVLSDYTGWQMVTYGSIATPNPYFRSFGDNGTRSEWRQLAFLTDNVASATKLQTARTIWGQSFDGSANVSGALYDASNQEFIYSSGNLVRLGTGTAAKGCNTYIDGNNIYLRYGTTYNDGIALTSSGNALIGTTSDNGVNKLQVKGSIRASFGQFGHILINKGYGDKVGDYTIETSTAGAMLYINYYHNGGLNLCRGGGNVLIGTTTDSGYKLDVNGSVRLDGVHIANTPQLLFSHGGDYFDCNGNFVLAATSRSWHIFDTSNARSLFSVQRESGNVLIGAVNDNGAKLQVDGDATAKVLVANKNGDGGAGAGLSLYYSKDFVNTYGIHMSQTSAYGTKGDVTGDWATYFSMTDVANGGWIFRGLYGNVVAISNTSGNLTVTGDITSEGTIAMAKLASSSDAKLKENIKWLSADKSIEVVRALRPTEWNWKKDRTHSFGFIAQDVQPIIPEMVSSVNDTLRLEYNQLHAFEIGAIQHIDSEVEILKHRVNELENELKQYRRNA